MKQLLLQIFMITLATITTVIAQPQQLDLYKVKSFEIQLDDVMELIDTNQLKTKLHQVQEHYKNDSNEINKVRLGIIYHETALNLAFFSKTKFKGYAKKSFEVLNELFISPHTSKELYPFIATYRASALSLVSAETGNLKLLGKAFVLFEDAVENYATVSYLPEFLRGSGAENLP